MKRWPRLFSPLQLGPLTLPNRIMMPGMDPSLADASGHATPAMIRHYADRARGGVGLIVTGNIACDRPGRVSPWMAMIHDDDCIPGLASVADAVHAEGGRIFFQVSHAGRQTLEDFAGGETVSASAIPCPVMRSRPRALAKDEVYAVAQRFAEGARRAQQAGADGVEFHMAHGYLVCQFLSPYSNKRTDHWGGDAEGRGRFAVEIVERTRALVGPDFPIQCRLSADERVDGGILPPLALTYAKRLVAAGATSLSISACNYESYRFNMPSYYMPRRTYADLARFVRAGLREDGLETPIVAVGRFAQGDDAEAALAAGDADLIAFGRALIADADLPNRLAADDEAHVRPCVACNRCAEAITRGPLRCLVNPEAGRGPDVAAPAETHRRVLVVGGGPAGVTAAVEAARRGHDVRLVEASNALGGKAVASGEPPEKDAFTRYAEWLAQDAHEAGVAIELGERATAEAVAASDADAIILATGAAPNPAPPIPGLEDQLVLHPEAALADPTPRRQVLIIGGGPEGCEVADALAHRPEQPQVDIVELRRKVGLGLPTSVRALLEERLAEAGVGLHTRLGVGRFTGDGVELVDRRDRIKATLPCPDLVVLAIGVRRPDTWDTLDDPRVVCIGDATNPATILEAVADGWRVGRSI